MQPAMASRRLDASVLCLGDKYTRKQSAEAKATWNESSSEWVPFDFVEIGTADFRTLSQFLVGSDRTCAIGDALRTWNLDKVRGVAVEPVSHLLDRLPMLPCVRKENVAMGSTDGAATLHFVPVVVYNIILYYIIILYYYIITYYYIILFYYIIIFDISTGTCWRCTSVHLRLHRRSISSSL